MWRARMSEPVIEAFRNIEAFADDPEAATMLKIWAMRRIANPANRITKAQYDEAMELAMKIEAFRRTRLPGVPLDGSLVS